VKTFIGWVVGIFTAFVALGALGQAAWLAFLSFLLATACSLPPLIKYMRKEIEKRNRSVRSSLIVTGYFVFFIAGVAILPKNEPVDGEVQHNEKAGVSTAKVPAKKISPDSPPEQKEAANSDRAYFPFTAEQFIDRFNSAMSSLERNIVVQKKNENNNGPALTIQLAGNNIGLVLSANNKDRRLHSFTFIGAGDGTPNSGMDITMGIAACVMAVDNPGMPPHGREEILKQLGLSDGRFSESGKIEIQRNGVKYSLTQNQQIGTWFIGEVFGEVSALTSIDNQTQSRSTAKSSKAQSLSLDDSIVAQIKERARQGHPGDHATQQYVIEEQMNSALALRNISDNQIPESEVGQIKRRAALEHPGDYSTQLYVVNEQMAAYKQLFATPQTGMPESVLDGIYERIENDHRGDYSTQLYVLQEEIAAYEKLNE
jgi:hypothetical protein